MVSLFDHIQDPNKSMIHLNSSTIKDFELLQANFDASETSQTLTIIEALLRNDLDAIPYVRESLKGLCSQNKWIEHTNVGKLRIKIINNTIQCLEDDNELFYSKNSIIQEREEEEVNSYVLSCIEVLVNSVISLHFNSKDFLSDIDKKFKIGTEMFKEKNLHLETNFIGEGGFAKIFKNQTKEGPVGIKFLKKPDLTPNLKQFYKEFCCLRKLQHKNIIKCYGFTHYNNTVGLVLEFCSLGTLKKFLRNYPDMNIKQKLNIALKISKALEYIHLNNVCHYDIKPSNILINQDLEPKLSDFGISRTEKNFYNIKVGYTLYYSAPEHLNGFPTKKSDVWSFGLTIAFILLGNDAYGYLKKNDNPVNKSEFIYEVCTNLKRPLFPERFDIDHPRIYSLINRMVDVAADKRPTMREVRQELMKISDEY